MIASDRQSIFGDTYGGVPNPQIPFQHPYPTRYHGAIFTTPRFGMPFIAQPMARVPYSGLGAPPAPAPSPVLMILGSVAVGALVGTVSGAVVARSSKASSERAGRVAGVSYGVFGGLTAVALAIAIMAGASAAKPTAG